jgi:hypothetical protein
MTFFSYGQSDSTDNNNFVSIHFLELGLLDTKFSFEHRLNWHNSLLFDLGYKFAIHDEIDNSESGYAPKGLRNYDYNGYNISVGYNYYLKRRNFDNQCYFSGMAMFYKKYRDNFIGVSGEDGSYGYGLTSVQQDIKEFKVLFGCRTTQHRNKRKSIESFGEYYFGFGIRNLVTNIIYYGYSGGRDPRPTLSQINFTYFTKPEIETDKVWRIRPCFGVKMGIGWNKNRTNHS